MRIKTTQTQGGWQADCEDLPGSPPVGTGATEQGALVCLFYRMHFERLSSGRSWWSFIIRGPIEINGKLWRDAHDAR